MNAKRWVKLTLNNLNYYRKYKNTLTIKDCLSKTKKPSRITEMAFHRIENKMIEGKFVKIVLFKCG